jgi:hypothetical protein
MAGEGHADVADVYLGTELERDSVGVVREPKVSAPRAASGCLEHG